MRVEHLDLWYGTFQGLKGVSVAFPAQRITALIGPSGCGKSTLLRCLNRMNDLVAGVRVTGGVFARWGEHPRARRTWSNCGVASGWCSSVRIPFR
jgi:ABC-type phosphate transport system ATPase subunit